MQKSDHGFEQIMSAVLEQRQVWEKLQAENRELRQQLIDLRAGRGISIEIANQRFEVVWEANKAGTQAEAAAGKRSQTAKPVKAVQSSSTPSSGVLEEMLLDELSSAMDNRMGQSGEMNNRAHQSGERKPSTSFNEEQKANLRRDLAGSFLLE